MVVTNCLIHFDIHPSNLTSSVQDQFDQHRILLMNLIGTWCCPIIILLYQNWLKISSFVFKLPNFDFNRCFFIFITGSSSITRPGYKQIKKNKSAYSRISSGHKSPSHVQNGLYSEVALPKKKVSCSNNLLSPVSTCNLILDRDSQSQILSEIAQDCPRLPQIARVC